MPLSKKRDKERKHKERAKIRLDKPLSSLGERKPVQPKEHTTTASLDPDARYRVRIDADGNPIPELT